MSNDFQESIIKKYNAPLLILKVNYPGINKDNDITNNIIESIDELLSDIFSIFINFKILRITREGPLVLMSINKDAVELKDIAIQIEDKHILGKCVNIEVFDINMNKLSRTQLGYEPRQCFICGDDAGICIEQDKHKRDEIVKYIVNKYSEYMESFHRKKE